MKKTLIALVAHEVIRALAASTGDTSAPAWADAPEALRNAMEAGVDTQLASKDTTPAAAHDAWVAARTADGWKKGAKADAKKKTHPNLVPFAELPAEKKAKDHLFNAVVLTLAALPEPEAVEKVVEKLVERTVDVASLTAEAIYAQMGEAARTGMAALIVANSPEQAPPPVPVAVPAGYVPVQYVGKRATYTDSLYGSGLTFIVDQTRHVPPTLARQFLRHADVFQPGKAEDATLTPAAPVDDTQAAIQKAQQELVELQRLQNERQDLVDRVNQMDSKGLVHHALTNYRIPLDEAKPVDELRVEVNRLIDQFGVV